MRPALLFSTEGLPESAVGLVSYPFGNHGQRRGVCFRHHPAGSLHPAAGQFLPEGAPGIMHQQPARLLGGKAQHLGKIGKGDGLVIMIGEKFVDQMGAILDGQTPIPGRLHQFGGKQGNEGG